MKNQKKKDESTKEKKTRTIKLYNVYGFLELLVALSVGYLITIVWLGTDTLEPKILAVPAMGYVAFTLIKKFVK